MFRVRAAGDDGRELIRWLAGVIDHGQFEVVNHVGGACLFSLGAKIRALGQQRERAGCSLRLIQVKCGCGVLSLSSYIIAC